MLSFSSVEDVILFHGVNVMLCYHLYQLVLSFISVLRIRDVYPGSWFLPLPDPGSRISDPGSKNSNRRERWKNFFCHTFLCSHKFHKIVNYFSFEVLKKKIGANFQRNIELFTKKIVKKLLKIWSWDPGSEIRDPGSGKNLFWIPDPGVKKAPDPDPQHWFILCYHLMLSFFMLSFDAKIWCYFMLSFDVIISHSLQM